MTVAFGTSTFNWKRSRENTAGPGIGRSCRPGSYRFSASARLAGDVIDEDSGEFVIERHSVEDGDLRADTLLLQQIAQVSGGRYRRLDDWQPLMRSLNLQTQILEDVETHRLWGSIWPMIAVVALLAAEWTMRKRHRHDLTELSESIMRRTPYHYLTLLGLFLTQTSVSSQVVPKRGNVRSRRSEHHDEFVELKT